MKRVYVGIDPGKNGGMAVMLPEGPQTTAWAHSTPHDIAEELRCLEVDHALVAHLEKVHSMPKQGVASTFALGENYGTWVGILTAIGIPYETVAPGTWQRSMRCLSGGDKRVTKRRAQELFPGVKITHATADALLIAEHCRRTWL